MIEISRQYGHAWRYDRSPWNRGFVADGRDHTQAFTIVELLIVIVVIGILAAITIVAYNGVQQRARDAERQQDISTIQKLVEMYYVDHGAFPPTTDMQSPTWRAANLATKDQGPFINPSDPNSTNSVLAPGSTVTIKQYSYYSNKSDGTLCTSGDTDCTQYHMAWRLESDPSVVQTKNVSR